MSKSKINSAYIAFQFEDNCLLSKHHMLHSHYLEMDQSLQGIFEDGDKYVIPEAYQHMEAQQFIPTPKPFGKY